MPFVTAYIEMRRMRFPVIRHVPLDPIPPQVVVNGGPVAAQSDPPERVSGEGFGAVEDVLLAPMRDRAPRALAPLRRVPEEKANAGMFNIVASVNSENYAHSCVLFTSTDSEGYMGPDGGEAWV